MNYWEHLSAKWLWADKGVNKNNELGSGGNLIEVDDKYSTYKIIPETYSKIINTRLKGTFYVNPLGKVYYEHNKPLGTVAEKEVLACVAPSTLSYEFEVIGGLGTITGWSGNATHLVIPASFKMSEGGKEWCEPVRVIGAGAFQNGNFKRVTIPQSVQEIQDGAFQDGELTEIEIPHSVINIGNNAFKGNPATNSGTSDEDTSKSKVVVKGSSSDRNISDSAFGESDFIYSPITDKDLGTIVRTKVGSNGEKTASIAGKTSSSSSSSSGEDSSSSKDYSNTVITIPKEIEVNGELLPITEIEKGAFQGSGLIDVIMPEGLLYIHDYAFAGNQLIRAIIPNSVISVGNYAFAYNEIASKPTIDPIKILESKFLGNFTDVNNEGNISQQVSSVDLKDHIFIISSMGKHIVEDVGTNPGELENNPDDKGDSDTSEEQTGLINPVKPREPEEGERPIYSAEDLAKIGKDYPLNGHYILMNDVNLSMIDNWEPIGNENAPFRGQFDGNGYKINNLKVTRENINYVGLFGYVDGATITNVALLNVDVKGNIHTGGLAGRAYYSTITNSYAVGDVTGNERVGGLVGLAVRSPITNSYATGSVRGNKEVGGLVGWTWDYSTITNSYATGSVTGNGTVGGLVGLANPNSTIKNSYATGSVSGNNYVGGLVGNAYISTITNSYATGSVRGNKEVGGLAGRVSSSIITDSYWDKETTRQNSSAGRGATGKNTDEMKQSGTYTNWNFNTVWKIDEGNDYPKLR